MSEDGTPFWKAVTGWRLQEDAPSESRWFGGKVLIPGDDEPKTVQIIGTLRNASEDDEPSAA
jgi:hypothetical protein